MLKGLKFTSQFILFSSLMALSACGQKGELYLPEEPKSNQVETDTKETTESPETGNN